MLRHDYPATPPLTLCAKTPSKDIPCVLVRNNQNYFFRLSHELIEYSNHSPWVSHVGQGHSPPSGELSGPCNSLWPMECEQKCVCHWGRASAACTHHPFSFLLLQWLAVPLKDVGPLTWVVGGKLHRVKWQLTHCLRNEPWLWQITEELSVDVAESN